MNCPFKMYGAPEETCEDCGAVFKNDMECGLAKTPMVLGTPITAGVAAVCDPAQGICESCE